MIANIIFYAFSFFLIVSAILVISSRNSVHSVFFLILSFFLTAGLVVLIGAEYLAMTLVIVYVGAVAVLFLFVVMMLNVDFASLKSGFHDYLPIGLLVAFILFLEMGGLFYVSMLQNPIVEDPAVAIPESSIMTNAHAIGAVLYTDYAYLFQMSGLVLLVAMIGAIVLTLRVRPDVKRQKIASQNARKRADGVALINVTPGDGGIQ